MPDISDLWFLICWLSLGGLLVAHAYARRTWVSGQTAFSAPWFVSLTVLWWLPASRKYLTAETVWLVIAVHFAFFAGSLLVPRSRRSVEFEADLAIALDETTVVRLLSAATTVIGLIGAVLTASSTGALASFREGTLALTRSLVLGQNVDIPSGYRLMANMLYPAGILAPITFLLSKRRFLDWLHAFLPVLGAMVYGFAFGGRGAAFIVTPMIFCVFVVCAESALALRRAQIVGLAVAAAAAAAFSILITSTRGDAVANAGFSWYVGGPIPALSSWMRTHAVPLLNFDITRFAIIREVLNTFGASIGRSIDTDIAYVPDPINVFTYIAEHLMAFGVVGTVVIAGLLGGASSLLERGPLTITQLALRATLYTYLIATLFADLSFFIVGFWLTLLCVSCVRPMGATISRFRRTILRERLRHPAEATGSH